MTAFGAPTRATEMDGAGEFDGVMLGAFRRPRIEGRFRGRAMQAFDVIWGDAEGDVVVENSYANVTNAVDHARHVTHGRVGPVLARLSAPRRGRGDQRAHPHRRPPGLSICSMRSISRTIRSTASLPGEFHVYGPYTRPFGFGRMTIDDGTAYGERFSTASAGLRFEGNGVRLDAMQIAKGTGAITGAAYVGWNGTYSFNAEGRGLAVESLDIADVPRPAAVHRRRAFHRRRQRDLCRAALRRPDRRSGSVFRRRRASARSPAGSPCATNR